MNIPSGVGGILQTIILMIGIIIIGAIVADMYGIVQKSDKRSIATQDSVNATSAQVNATVGQILEGQENANFRGNLTIEYFTQVFDKLLSSERNIQGNLTDHRIVANYTRDTLEALVNESRVYANQSFINQETFFKPYLNESFDKIFKALNISEEKEIE